MNIRYLSISFIKQSLVFKEIILYICLITLFCINLTICFKRGIEDFELGAIKYLSKFHHCLGDSESDFNLVAMLSLKDCFDSRISCCNSNLGRKNMTFLHTLYAD